MATTALPGDIILTRSKGLTGWLIRLGAAIRNRHAVHNHVIVAHHYDEAGVLWGIEGRPGGVGWVDCRAALADRWTLTNADQPRTDEDREFICHVVKGALDASYDWVGIVAAAMQSIGAQALWAQNWRGKGPPAHYICSALADWAHEKRGLASPEGSRLVIPGDWGGFIVLRGWDP